jgi:endonuclease/exonuclease/phosphatase family metal-dependent hydrolase
MQLTKRDDKSAQSLPIRIITHNIRYAATNLDHGEQPWQVRAPQLIAELRFNTINSPTAFICLQEVLHSQLIDILDALNEDTIQTGTPEWAFLGVGRDDGKKAGEFCPILYRPAIWKLVNFKTLWLSQTPDRPSRGWDAACNRILTIGVFTHHASNQCIVAMNTHLDHVGMVSQRNSANLIVQEVAKTSNTSGSIASETPIFLAGDFNSEPTQEAYNILNSARSPIQDLRELIIERRQYGYRDTFTGFDESQYKPARIDFLFLSKNGMWKSSTYAVLENRFDGLYFSDHRAVVADVKVTS